MAPRLAEAQRKLIIALRESGHTISQIKQKTSISRQTIYLWLKRWEESGSIQAHHRQFYQRATTEAQDAQIVAAHKENPFLPTQVTSSKNNITPWTVRRRLKEAGLKCRRSARKNKWCNLQKEVWVGFQF